MRTFTWPTSFNAHQEGYDNIELLKRYTTVGMGPSQGKLANMNADPHPGPTQRQVDRRDGHDDLTAVPPARADRRNWPAGASIPCGTRPCTTGTRGPAPSSARRALAAAGVLSVAWAKIARRCHPRRGTECAPEGVGLIDIGTLGKFEVSGPDAAAFLERVYTGQLREMRTGRLTYAVACDESGVLIEDGLVARLGEDRFYVTATTTGAAALFQEMQRWAIVWRMNVVLVNATGPLVGDEPGRPALARGAGQPDRRGPVGGRVSLTWRCARGPWRACRPGCFALASSANWATRSTSRPDRRWRCGRR